MLAGGPFRRGPGPLLLVLVALCLVGAVSYAIRARPEPASSPEAVALLRDAIEAEETTVYEGMKDISWRGGDVETPFFVRHLSDGRTHMQASGVPAARRKRRPLVMDASRFYWLRDFHRLLENYVVDHRGEEAVAERIGVVVTIEPRLSGRPSRRLVIDRETGVLLRQEDFDADGRRTFYSSFRTLFVAGDPEGGTAGVRDRPRSLVRDADTGPFSGGHEGHRSNVGFSPLAARYLPEGFVRTTVWESCCGRPTFREVFDDGLAWFEMRQVLAGESAERYVVRKSCGGSVWRMRVVIGDVEISVSGTLSPAELLAVLESLGERPAGARLGALSPGS